MSLRVKSFKWVLPSVFAVLVAACSSSSTQPSGSTASVTAPRASQPANGITIPNAAQPVTLIVLNALITKPGGATYTFEVSTDQTFATKVQIRDVAEGGNGQTGVQLTPLAPGTDYYWHVRGTAGGTTGLFSSVNRFTIGPAITLNPPVPIGPLNGAQTTSRPAFRVTNATRQGTLGPITYSFEISTTSTFASTIMTGSNREGINETGFIPTTDLPSTGTLYWRATAMDAASGTTSAPSAVQSFTANIPSSPAGILAAALGVVLWPGDQPEGANGQATLGDNWAIQTLYHVPSRTAFQSPTVEMLRFFDLFDRGLDPQGAINWMNGHGYSTTAQWYPPPEKAVLGLQFVYLSARYKAVDHGTWDLVLKTE